MQSRWCCSKASSNSNGDCLESCCSTKKILWPWLPLLTGLLGGPREKISFEFHLNFWGLNSVHIVLGRRQKYQWPGQMKSTWHSWLVVWTLVNTGYCLIFLLFIVSVTITKTFLTPSDEGKGFSFLLSMETLYISGAPRFVCSICLRLAHDCS